MKFYFSFQPQPRSHPPDTSKQAGLVGLSNAPEDAGTSHIASPLCGESLLRAGSRPAGHPQDSPALRNQAIRPEVEMVGGRKLQLHPCRAGLSGKHKFVEHGKVVGGEVAGILC